MVTYDVQQEALNCLVVLDPEGNTVCHIFREEALSVQDMATAHLIAHLLTEARNKIDGIVQESPGGQALGDAPGCLCAKDQKPRFEL